ncbi:hypothetical protein [Mycolicibacterium setense]
MTAAFAAKPSIVDEKSARITATESGYDYFMIMRRHHTDARHHTNEDRSAPTTAGTSTFSFTVDARRDVGQWSCAAES